MSENDLIDIYSTKEIFYDKGEWKVRKKTVTQKYNPLLRTWKKLKTETEILPISEWEPSLVKEIETQFLVKRIATDTHTLLPLQAFFVQKIKISAKKDNPHEFINEFEGGFFLHDLNSGTTQPLAMTDERIKRIGEPKRLSNNELRELIASGLQVYTQRPSGELILDISP